MASLAPDGTPSPGGPGATPDGGAPRPGASAQKRISVEVTARDGFDVAIPSALVEIVDANGKLLVAHANATGVATIVDVMPPYDVSATATDALPAFARRTIVLGRTETALDVPIQVYPAQNQPDPGEAAFAVTMSLPPCYQPSCPITVASASAHGYGYTLTSYPTNGTIMNMTVPLHHSFTAPVAVPEPVSIWVVTSNPALVFWGHTSTTTSAMPGTVAQVSAGAVGGKPIVGPLTVNVTNEEPSTAWDTTISLYLKLPTGGPRVKIASKVASSVVSNIPDIAGGALTVDVFTRDPSVETEPGVERGAFVGTDPVANAASTLAMSVADVPDMVSPSFGGTLAPGAKSIAWNASGKGAASFAVHDSVANKGIARILTDDTSIPLARLAPFGIELAPGSYSAELVTKPGRSLATFIDAHANPRRPFHTDGEDSHTLQRFRFTVD